MSTHPPYAVLYVDDEVKALEYFREAFEDEFHIHTASNALDAHQILLEEGEKIGVILSDQRMPGENGVELLERARQLNPNLVRILVTAYAEYQTAVDAVNSGHAFRFLHKPWNPEELCEAIQHGLRYYTTLTEREELLREKTETVRKSLMSDRVNSMGILAEGLNHHIRNALTVVRAFIELTPHKLAEELDGRPPNDAGFWVNWQGQALSQLDRIQSLLTHLSSASHAKHLPRIDFVQLHDVLSETFDQFTNQLTQKGVDITLNLHPDLPGLIVNRERFLQLWQLLLTQVLADLDSSHRLEIEASLDRSKPNGGHVVIRIRDNAYWPEDAPVSNLFEPFFVRGGQPHEFGVNMMACSVIVHLHGGSIEAHRLHPQGIELEIHFPVEPPESIDNEASFFDKLMDHERRWKEREIRESFDQATLMALP
jgi:CheY-like chemotaxis protein